MKHSLSIGLKGRCRRSVFAELTAAYEREVVRSG